MTPASPELVAIVEAGLVCPKCQAINIPGAKPYIKLASIVCCCDVCAHAGPVTEFQPEKH
jgi:hypothetical protein